MKHFSLSQISQAQQQVVDLGLWVQFSDHRNTHAANHVVAVTASAKKAEVHQLPGLAPEMESIA